MKQIKIEIPLTLSPEAREELIDFAREFLPKELERQRERAALDRMFEDGRDEGGETPWRTQ